MRLFYDVLCHIRYVSVSVDDLLRCVSEDLFQFELIPDIGEPKILSVGTSSVKLCTGFITDSRYLLGISSGFHMISLLCQYFWKQITIQTRRTPGHPRRQSKDKISMITPYVFVTAYAPAVCSP